MRMQAGVTANYAVDDQCQCRSVCVVASGSTVVPFPLKLAGRYFSLLSTLALLSHLHDVTGRVGQSAKVP